MNPFNYRGGNFAPGIDKMLGNAYYTVKQVADQLATLAYIAANLPVIQTIAAAFPNLAAVAAQFAATIRTPDGSALNPLPTASNRLGTILSFDNNGQPVCLPYNGGGSGSGTPFKFELLTVTAVNTLSNLSLPFAGDVAIVFINGQAYRKPSFNIVGFQVTWNPTASGITLNPGSTEVMVLYSTNTADLTSSQAFLSILNGILATVPVVEPTVSPGLWLNGGLVSYSKQ